MIWGFVGGFFGGWGGKGVGTGQYEENYRLCFLGKPPALYQVPKLRNLIFFILRGMERGTCVGVWGDLRDIFGGQRSWEWSDRGELLA